MKLLWRVGEKTAGGKERGLSFLPHGSKCLESLSHGAETRSFRVRGGRKKKKGGGRQTFPRKGRKGEYSLASFFARMTEGGKRN